MVNTLKGGAHCHISGRKWKSKYTIVILFRSKFSKMISVSFYRRIVFHAVTLTLKPSVHVLGESITPWKYYRTRDGKWIYKFTLNLQFYAAPVNYYRPWLINRTIYLNVYT